MSVYFCADLHFGHKAMMDMRGMDIGYEFSCLDEYNEWMINLYNQVVSKKDKCFILGDVCWHTETIKLLQRLKGMKAICLGNHDIGKEQGLSQHAKVHGQIFYKGAILSHVPVHPDSINRNAKVNIHGHTHSNLVYTNDDILGGRKIDKRYYCVSLERINYKPISYEEIMEGV